MRMVISIAPGACDKCARQWHGRSGIVHDENRHHRLQLQGGEQGFVFALMMNLPFDTV